MAVPARRTGKARKNKSRSRAWKATAPTLVKCSKCGALMMPHRVCKSCGSYNKKEIISVDYLLRCNLTGCPFWGSRCLFAKQEETLT